MRVTCSTRGPRYIKMEGFTPTRIERFRKKGREERVYELVGVRQFKSLIPETGDADLRAHNIRMLVPKDKTTYATYSEFNRGAFFTHAIRSP